MFSCLFVVVLLVSLQSRSLCAKRSGKNTYDYIVVGSGSAGSMVASELVKLFPKDEILLFEEGSFSRVNGEIDNLISWVNVANDPNVNRGYTTVAQSQLNNREIGLSRAKITGGCNSHNGNAHILADEMDFDRWGNIAGWSLDDILDIWDEIKQVSPGEKFDETNEFIQRLLFAAQETGYPYNDDYFDLRDGTQVGSTPLVLQGNVINDSYVRRGSSWTQFVEPLLPNDNLEIVVLTRVNKILFEEKGGNNYKIKAIGVEAENLGTFEKINFYARKEIIISGGVYDTPKLLMLSGIGDCYNELNKFGINCIKHLPGVGKNLQDHFITVLEYEFVDFDDENDSNNEHDLTPILDELTSISRNGGSWHPGIVTVSNESRYIQFIGPIVNGGDFSVEIIGVGISDIIISQQLLSVGSVKLFDSDPNSQPIIDHNYLNDENGEDIETVLEGIKRQRDFIDSTTAFDDYFRNYNIGIIEITPGRDNVNTDDEIKEYIRNAGIGGSHPTSSCKMGKEYDDNSIVVNEKLQVIGINNLRIADASIMPKTVSANINLMCMVIGKKAAQFIAQDWQN